MRTAIITNNHNLRVIVLTDLNIGDKLIATGIGDFDEGATYEVASLHCWDGTMVSYVVDNWGVSRFATPELFYNKAEYRERQINSILDE